MATSGPAAASEPVGGAEHSSAGADYVPAGHDFRSVTETVSDMGRKSEVVSVIPVAVFDYHGTTIQQPLHEIKNIRVAESE